MTPEVCTAAVGALAESGAGDGVWLVAVLAVCVVLAGGAGLLLARRRPGRLAGAATIAAAVVLASAVTAPVAPARAADEPTVVYSACTLVDLAVVADQAAWEAAVALQPGDELVAMTVQLRSLSTLRLALALTAEVDDPALAAVLEVSLRAGGVPVTSVDLDPGDTVQLDVVLRLPPSVGNSVQGAAGGMTFSLSATEV